MHACWSAHETGRLEPGIAVWAVPTRGAHGLAFTNKTNASTTWSYRFETTANEFQVWNPTMRLIAFISASMSNGTAMTSRMRMVRTSCALARVARRSAIRMMGVVSQPGTPGHVATKPQGASSPAAVFIPIDLGGRWADPRVEETRTIEVPVRGEVQSRATSAHGRQRTAAVAAGRAGSTYPLCAVNNLLGETRNHWTNRVRACFADSALRPKKY
jgi:hypothetical protein